MIYFSYAKLMQITHYAKTLQARQARYATVIRVIAGV